MTSEAWRYWAKNLPTNANHKDHLAAQLVFKTPEANNMSPPKSLVDAINSVVTTNTEDSPSETGPQQLDEIASLKRAAKMKGKFTPAMLSKMKNEYAKIRTIDPSGAGYDKMIELLNSLDKTQLKQIADGQIKFLSSLATNRLNRGKMKNEQALPWMPRATGTRPPRKPGDKPDPSSSSGEMAGSLVDLGVGAVTKAAKVAAWVADWIPGAGELGQDVYNLADPYGKLARDLNPPTDPKELEAYNIAHPERKGRGRVRHELSGGQVKDPRTGEMVNAYKRGGFVASRSGKTPPDMTLSTGHRSGRPRYSGKGRGPMRGRRVELKTKYAPASPPPVTEGTAKGAVGRTVRGMKKAVSVIKKAREKRFPGPRDRRIKQVNEAPSPLGGLWGKLPVTLVSKARTEKEKGRTEKREGEKTAAYKRREVKHKETEAELKRRETSVPKWATKGRKQRELDFEPTKPVNPRQKTFWESKEKGKEKGKKKKPERKPPRIANEPLVKIGPDSTRKNPQYTKTIRPSDLLRARKESVELDEAKSFRDYTTPASPKIKKWIESGKQKYILNVLSVLGPTTRFVVVENPNWLKSGDSKIHDKVLMFTISDPKKGRIKMFAFHGSHVSHQKAMQFAKNNKLVAKEDAKGNSLYAEEQRRKTERGERKMTRAEDRARQREINRGLDEGKLTDAAKKAARKAARVARAARKRFGQAAGDLGLAGAAIGQAVDPLFRFATGTKKTPPAPDSPEGRAARKLRDAKRKENLKDSVELDEKATVAVHQYKDMMKWYETSNARKVFDILDKKGWRLGAEGFTLVQNVLKNNRDNVKKTADEIMKKYPQFNRLDEGEIGEGRWSERMDAMWAGPTPEGGKKKKPKKKGRKKKGEEGELKRFPVNAMVDAMWAGPTPEGGKKKGEVNEVSPPGFEGTVKAMKGHPEIDNPFALAWYMKNKGNKSHKNPDGTDKS